MAVVPQVSAGLIRLPSVSVPTANGTVPATVLAAGPGKQWSALNWVLGRKGQYPQARSHQVRQARCKLQSGS